MVADALEILWGQPILVLRCLSSPIPQKVSFYGCLRCSFCHAPKPACSRTLADMDLVEAAQRAATSDSPQPGFSGFRDSGMPVRELNGFDTWLMILQPLAGSEDGMKRCRA